MKLLKYPVTTKNGEYQVLVYEKYVACGMISYNVDVQIPYKSLFSKFKTVRQYSLWRSDFEKRYNHNYVGYAKDAVLQYENDIKGKLEMNKAISDNLKAWDQWDGVII